MTRFGHKLNYVINTFVKHTPDHCLFIYLVNVKMIKLKRKYKIDNVRTFFFNRNGKS